MKKIISNATALILLAFFAGNIYCVQVQVHGPYMVNVRYLGHPIVSVDMGKNFEEFSYNVQEAIRDQLKKAGYQNTSFNINEHCIFANLESSRGEAWDSNSANFDLWRNLYQYGGFFWVFPKKENNCEN